MDLEKVKKSLQEELESLRHSLKELEQEKEDISEVSVKETSEAALRYEMQEDYHLVKENLEKRLKQVERALEKIEENTYGLCDECKNPIEVGRLEIDYAVNLCKSCSFKK